MITGPPKELSFQAVEDLFKRFMKYDLVGHREWKINNDRKAIEISFSSIRPHGGWAIRIFKENWPGFVDGHFDIEFGKDPCEPKAAAPVRRLDLSWRSRG